MKHFKIIIAALLALQTTAAYAKDAKLALGSKGDAMEFDKTQLSAKAGDKIKLTFKNNSSKSANLQHNFVLTRIGSTEKVVNDSMAAGADKGWIAESDQIIAHTKLLDPGKSETITFDAPKEPGEYPYVCTYPGHAAMMKGVLKVSK
jgi:azurin